MSRPAFIPRKYCLKGENTFLTILMMHRFTRRSLDGQLLSKWHCGSYLLMIQLILMQRSLYFDYVCHVHFANFTKDEVTSFWVRIKRLVLGEDEETG